MARVSDFFFHFSKESKSECLNGPLVMEKVFEVFILYMGMVASFGHVTKLI